MDSALRKGFGVEGSTSWCRGQHRRRMVVGRVVFVAGGDCVRRRGQEAEDGERRRRESEVHVRELEGWWVAGF